MFCPFEERELLQQVLPSSEHIFNGVKKPRKELHDGDNFKIKKSQIRATSAGRGREGRERGREGEKPSKTIRHFHKETAKNTDQ